ncbi:TA system VapC family ribonuclease toxin [Glaciibacter superstes]|uniref:TA system VapC family ribonuclease toxin n=1 Tax=Glaciibacter superstes TaxID=501023 RepID=UPI0003B60808|nr:TA system VapC family ribonuclease toxin [Glaciibacter superstes]
MIVLDVNVLLAAFRADHPHHPQVRPWSDQVFTTGDGIAVPDFVWVGFLRLVTSTHIFEVPSTVEEAFAFTEAVVTSPSYRSVPGLTDGLDIFKETATAGQARDNLIPDAYIAAVARAHSCPVVTLDRDFRRFDYLRIVDPRLAA